MTESTVLANTSTVLNLNTTVSPSVPFNDITLNPCQWILYADINNSRVRVWDLIILVPNGLFLMFLIFGFRTAVAKLRASSSPIFTAFYGLVLLVSAFSVLRCIVAMTVNASVLTGDVVDKILWLVLRFFILATELSVVIFGLAFGHLDSRTSIQRVLLVTFTIALGYSFIQGTLELVNDHPVFSSKSGSHSDNSTAYDNYDLFAHGGMIFLFTTSVFFFLVYSVIVILPFTKVTERFNLPTKRWFYYYCSLLAILNLCQSVASLLLYLDNMNSLCVIDVTTYIYFSFYNPLVYGAFLWTFFKTSQSGLQFSYKHQEDFMDDDQVSLPYSSHSITKNEDHSPIFSYDSTQFDVHSVRSDRDHFTTTPSLCINSDVSYNTVPT